MEENAKSVPVPAGRWLALIVAAVVLAEGIWAILVSVTRSLILPLLARIVGGDPQSALYLGKGDVNVPDLFGSVLQICLAAIVFLIIKSWTPKSSRGLRVVKTGKPAPSLSAAPQPVPPTAQAAAASAVPAQPQVPKAPPEAAQRAVQPRSAASPEPAKPSVQPQPASKPAKPKKPQEVYYNIVGEPMSPEDE